MMILRTQRHSIRLLVVQLVVRHSEQYPREHLFNTIRRHAVAKLE